jgi:hypothetical protein
MTHLDTSNVSYDQKSRIASISLCAGGVRHTVRKLLMRDSTLI